ncbi:MAG: TetR family transcriptional regulator [Steroidobacteraceae bacterium]
MPRPKPSPKHSPTRGRTRAPARASAAARERPRLTRDRVLAEALLLLRDQGLDGVSLRSLAARLGISAPSLYWHFPDKATLLGAMMERIFLDAVEALPKRRRWQAWMQAFAAALWQAQEGVRDFGRLLLTAPMDETQIARIEGRLAMRLAGLDIKPAEAMRLQSSVQVLVTGWFLFAHSRFSPALSGRLDFRRRMEHDLALLLEGEARRQRAKN